MCANKWSYTVDVWWTDLTCYLFRPIQAYIQHMHIYIFQIRLDSHDISFQRIRHKLIWFINIICLVFSVTFSFFFFSSLLLLLFSVYICPLRNFHWNDFGEENHISEIYKIQLEKCVLYSFRTREKWRKKKRRFAQTHASARTHTYLNHVLRWIVFIIFLILLSSRKYHFTCLCTCAC